MPNWTASKYAKLQKVKEKTVNSLKNTLNICHGVK